MERTRQSLKMQAKASLKTNYWKLVLVSLIALIISGGVSSPTAKYTFNVDLPLSHNTYEDYYYDDYYDDYDYDNSYDGPIDEAFSYIPVPIRILFGGLSGIALSVLAFLGIIGIIAVSILLLALDLLVWNPLNVGIHRFLLVNLRFPAHLHELAHSFNTNYWTAVKTMFFRDLKILLWSLLFIIPGIVKGYEYRMVPYLLAECPDMDSHEVFDASANLMDGNKWRAFVLDLSFIAWNILSGITFGLVGIFFVNPYQNLTDAAFYQAVCQEKSIR